MKRFVFVIATVISLAGTHNTWGSIEYTLTDLGDLGGGWSSTGDINNAGQIVGYSDTATGEEHAFYYYGGSGPMMDLGTLGGSLSQAIAINNSGQIIGYGTPASEYYGYHAFLYTGSGSFQYVLPGTMGSTASDINDNGQIVGRVMLPDGQMHAFLYSDGVMEDLGTLGGTRSRASAINESGLIVGYADTADGQTHAFLYSNGAMSDLGVLGGTYSRALDINESGQIVGQFIAGANPEDYAACLFDTSGTVTDLNTLIDPSLGWTLTFAGDINDNGLIVGSGINPSGDRHAYLLTPIGQTLPSEPPTQFDIPGPPPAYEPYEPPQPPNDTIPEPSTFIIWSLLATFAWCFGWKKHVVQPSSE